MGSAKKQQKLKSDQVIPGLESYEEQVLDKINEIEDSDSRFKHGLIGFWLIRRHTMILSQLAFQMKEANNKQKWYILNSMQRQIAIIELIQGSPLMENLFMALKVMFFVGVLGVFTSLIVILETTEFGETLSVAMGVEHMGILLSYGVMGSLTFYCMDYLRSQPETMGHTDRIVGLFARTFLATIVPIVFISCVLFDPSSNNELLDTYYRNTGVQVSSTKEYVKLFDKLEAVLKVTRPERSHLIICFACGYSVDLVASLLNRIVAKLKKVTEII